MAVTSYKFRWIKIPTDEYTVTKVSDDEYEVELKDGNVVRLEALEGELENV